MSSEDDTFANTATGLVAIGLAVVGAWWYFTGEDVPEKDPVIAAGEDAIELHLIRHANWRAVFCLKQPVDAINFVFCYPAGASGDYGPLFAVENQQGKPVVYPINGKAIPILKYGTIEKQNGEPIALARWSGKSIDIPKIIAAF